MDHGDWNDGMNRVGAKGKGESVWLAWFQIACFSQFAQLAESRGDTTRAADWRQRADALRAAVEQTRLGRGLVSSRLFRRWHPLGLGPERCVRDRLDRPDVGRCFPAAPVRRVHVRP